MVLQKFFNRFGNEYISAVKECYIYGNKRYNNSTDNLINDVVLVREVKTPRMKCKKTKVIEVIKGIDNHVIGLQFKLSQPSLNLTVTINRPLQLVVPSEMNKYERIETVTRLNLIVSILIVIPLLNFFIIF